MFFLRYIRSNPFSVMALCSITGDLGFLGFAFAAQGWVSLPKLLGALFTIAAHTVLLAFGDDQAKRVAAESGVIPRMVLSMRYFAQRALRGLPEIARRFIRAKPIGVPFIMLSLNGVGLLTDALLSSLPFAAAIAQTVLGICIIMGCGAFALADFTSKQKTANILLKIAPTLLTTATVANGCLALATLNGFVILSILAYLLANLAGFYTKIDKNAPISAGI